MRILLLTQWFQPEPTFKGLAFAKALQARGHEVEVLTGFPNYPGGKVYDGYRVRAVKRETMDGIRVTRGALYPSHDQSALRRILNYCSFAASTTLLALTLKRPDVVYVYTPPMTAAAGAVALRLLRRVPFVVDVQDLWPDTLAATGMVRHGWMMKAVGAWTNFVFRRASRIVVLSPGFKQTLEERGLSRPITVIFNWAPPEIVDQAQNLPAPSCTHGFNVLFAGNMGHAQALNVVIEAAKRLREQAPDVRFSLIGGGVDRDRLRSAAEAADLSNVVFLEPRHPKDMGPVFTDADALLVHLRDDPLFAITIPSKTQAYLVVGKPILMGVRGDAAAVVENAGAGITFAPQDVDALVNAVLRLRAMPPEARQTMGHAGADYYRARMSFEAGVAAVDETLHAAAAMR
jgi:glycosyltransferase involved in cell wall biosynthesis